MNFAWDVLHSYFDKCQKNEIHLFMFRLDIAFVHYLLKEKEKVQKQYNLTKMKVFLKQNFLVKISCKSDYKQESYWRLKT